MPDLFRYDRGELRKSVKTREGFLLVEGYIAKPGVLDYLHTDGTIQRELVTAETLHDPASLATLGRKPATLEHPDGSVTPDNVGDLAVGDVDGEVEIVQGGFVKVKMSIRRRDALNAIERGDKLELSPGYAITLDNTPGVHPVFGEYDAVQTSRRYNHVALTSAGRGGPSIRLRADSAADTSLIGDRPMDPRIIAALVSFMSTAGLRFDSSDIAEGDAKDVAGRIGELEDAFSKMKDDFAALAPKEDAEGAEGAEEEEEEEATDAEGFETAEEEKADSRRMAWHRARVGLDARADALGVKTDGLSNVALRKAIVLASARADSKEVKTDGSRAYFAAAYDLLPKTADASNRADAWTRIKPPGKDANDPTETREDGAAASDGWVANISEQFTARHAR